MEQNKMRCHVSIVIENAGKLLGALLFFAISQIDDVIKHLSDFNRMESKTYLLGFGVFVLAFLLVLGFHLFRWFKTTIWLEDGTIMVERDTMNKRKNTYNIKHISNIDMEQNLFERLIGTCKIKIDTNSSVLAGSTDIKIVFSKQKAMEFKRKILSYMGESEEKGVTEREKQEEFDVVYSGKDILLHCFYSVPILSLVILLGAIVGFFVLMRYVDTSYTFVDFVRDAIGGVVAIFLLVLSSAYSLVKGFFEFYGFQAKRSNDRIYINSGLLRKNMHTIPVDKINGIKLVQPLMSRFFGRYQVEVINIGTGDEKKESANLLLSCTKEEVRKYMQVLVPEYKNFIDQPIQKQSARYFYHVAYNLVMTALFLTIAFFTFRYFTEALPVDLLPTWVAFAAEGGILIVCLLGFVLSYLSSGYYIGQDYLIVTRGVLARTYSMIRYEKIQQMQIRETLLSKVTKLNKANVFILAALKNSITLLPLANEETLEQIAEKMLEAS